MAPRRVHAELRAGGERHGCKRIARLMRDAGLVGASRRRRGPVTTRRDNRARPAPDLGDRNFAADGPNQLWVADITFVPTAAGFLYLAVVLDAWSRRIVGWSMANHLRTELVLDALQMAIRQRRPSGEVIHHSDRGVQGGLNLSSQHWVEGRRDGGSAAFGSGSAGQTEVAWSAACGAAGAPAAVLGIYRGGFVERGRGDAGGGIAARSGPDGFARRVVWRHRTCRGRRGRRLGAISHLQSGRRSRCGERRVWAYERSHAGWGGRHRRYRVSCGATRRRGAATWITWRPPRSGTPSGLHVDRSGRSWLRTRRCGRMCRTG